MLTATLALVMTASKPLQELMDTERAFSARCEVVGFKKSFLEFFGEGCIMFAPGPVDAIAFLKSRPDRPATGEFTTLTWGPVVAGIAASNDFGFTTGWSKFVPPAGKGEITNGSYFSVWKKGASGWKVAIDMAPPGAFSQKEKLFEAGKAQPKDSVATLKGLDLDSPKAEKDAMVLHPQALTVSPGSRTQKGGDMASSNDMAYTYGTCKLSNDKPGNYIRVWRNRGKGWQVLLDIVAAQDE